uniref:Putative secreted protein n=1 Tax=Lutzomyia longipalpis TaxID=7200 RepID=A0A7G3AGY6_LUTLO
MIKMSVSLLYKTFFCIALSTALDLESPSFVFCRPLWLLSRLSRCSPNSDTISVPICSVSMATMLDLAKLAEVRSNTALPSRTVRLL